MTVIALGALVARLGWVSAESVRAALRDISARKRPEIIEADLRVFAAGLEAGGVAVPA